MSRRRALVPAVWLLEVPNVLLVAERRRRITRGDVDRFLALLKELPVASPTIPGHPRHVGRRDPTHLGEVTDSRNS